MKKRVLTALPAALMSGICVGLCMWGMYAKIEHVKDGSKILFSSMVAGILSCIFVLIYASVNKPNAKTKA